jgi:hypothetical protein
LSTSTNVPGLVHCLAQHQLQELCVTPKLVVDRHLTDRPLGAVTSVVVVPKLVLLRLTVPLLDRQVVTPKLVEQLMLCAWARAGKNAVSRRGTKMMCFIFVIEMVCGEPGSLWLAGA